MRLMRFLDKKDKKIKYCTVENESNFLIDGDIFSNYKVTKEKANISKILSPINPKSILCIGLNYKKHAAEGNDKIPEYPILFMKLANSVQNPEDPIIIPKHLESESVDFECELAVIIGKHCKNATKSNALDYVLGYTCSNDVSARDWQLFKGGSQWCRGKTFDTFCPLGPVITLKDEIDDPNSLNIKTILNGKTMQDWNTADMIFDVPTLIEFLSGSTTLEPGTIILTGTPHGIGFARNPKVLLKKGDTVTIEIEKIGKLTNPVIDEIL
jgi:2-keto-4-pentenoate hydratase/2-oxohepta-3-ene-1,7-dioic acid hydratase in catechol pathway|tara:strand:- start:270 stop:1076 length:807 start_codon:yes stop_codon:yes gene_type:complete